MTVANKVTVISVNTFRCGYVKNLRRRNKCHHVVKKVPEVHRLSHFVTDGLPYGGPNFHAFNESRQPCFGVGGRGGGSE